MENKVESTPRFCAYIILPDVENYKGDAFITYGQIEAMKEGEKAIILTRKCGVEFISEKQGEIARTIWDSWKNHAVNIYEITRTRDGAFRVPAVEYTSISPEIAEKIVEDWAQNSEIVSMIV